MKQVSINLTVTISHCYRVVTITASLSQSNKEQYTKCSQRHEICSQLVTLSDNIKTRSNRLQVKNKCSVQTEG